MADGQFTDDFPIKMLISHNYIYIHIYIYVGLPEGIHILDLPSAQRSQVAGNNGLKLPREFGLLIKQVPGRQYWVSMRILLKRHHYNSLLEPIGSMSGIYMLTLGVY